MLALGIGRVINLGDNEILFSGVLDHTQADIYWMDLAHGLVHRLTNDHAGEAEPVWSPDGQQIAYVTDLLDGRAIGTSVVLQNLKNNTPQELLHDFTNESYPQWSPDGRYIAFGKDAYTDGLPELIVLDLQSGSVRHISDKPRSANYPTWSPDGRYIAFTSGSINSENYEIHIVDLETGEIRPLVTTPSGGFFSSWSPDGRYIAFKVRWANGGIYLWDTLKEQSIFLYAPINTTYQILAWSPDSHSLLFSDFLDTNASNSGLFRLEIAGCIPAPTNCSPQLLMTGAYYDPRWRPHTP